MNIHDDPDDIEYSKAMELQMRKISVEQLHTFEGYAAEIFSMRQKAMMAIQSC